MDRRAGTAHYVNSDNAYVIGELFQLSSMVSGYVSRLNVVDISRRPALAYSEGRAAATLGAVTRLLMVAFIRRGTTSTF